MLSDWENLPADLAASIVSHARDIGIEPDYLAAVMHLETAGTFSPTIQNKYTKATGMIQFLPSTARWLGTTIEALLQMTAVEQMVYVNKYFKRMKPRNNLADVYLCVLWPAARNKPMGQVMWSHKLHPTA